MRVEKLSLSEESRNFVNEDDAPSIYRGLIRQAVVRKIHIDNGALPVDRLAKKLHAYTVRRLARPRGANNNLAEEYHQSK